MSAGREPDDESRPLAVTQLTMAVSTEMDRAARASGFANGDFYAVAEVALAQMRTAVARESGVGDGGWHDLLRRFRRRTGVETVFLCDARGLLVGLEGDLDRELAESVAAHLSVAVDRAGRLPLGELHSVSVRFRSRWLTGVRVATRDGDSMCLGFFGHKPVEPALGPPDCVGADEWPPFLRWALGPPPARAVVLADAAGLVVGCEPENITDLAEQIAPYLMMLYERVDCLRDVEGSPRIVAVRYEDCWLTALRVRLSRFRTLAAGIVGSYPTTDGRSFDIKRVMRQMLRRSFVLDRGS